MEDYVSYLIRFMEEIGEGGHMLAVCQPCVQTLVAVSVMSERKHPCTPRSMTLMAGPIDVRESPTSVNDLANALDATGARPPPLHSAPIQPRCGWHER